MQSQSVESSLTETLSHLMQPPGRVSVDGCHAALVFGLAVSLKPERVLELGIGAGYVTRTLLAAIKYNGIGSLTCVDNWKDWDGLRPPLADELELSGAKVVNANEADFLVSCFDGQFDLVFSDADHRNAAVHLPLLTRVCRPGGLILAHDVASDDFRAAVRYTGCPHHVFDTSSLPTERCERGLLMLWNTKARLF